MKLSRTVGLAVAVSLVAGTVTTLAQISGAGSSRPTANVVDADVSLVKPLTRDGGTDEGSRAGAGFQETSERSRS